MSQQVTWQESDLANAFVEKGRLHGVQIAPETAMQLANEVRSKAKLGDILDLTSVIKETTENLFPSDPEVVATSSAIEDVLSVTSRKMDAYLKKIAQSGPITPEEEEELRGGILDDVIIPMQEGVSEKVAEATRKTMHTLLPLQQEKNALDEYLNDTSVIDRLYDDMKADPTNKDKKNAYVKEQRARDQKNMRNNELIIDIDKLKSRLILLDAANGYIKRDLNVIDQYRGADGISRYFEKVLQPTINNIKDVIFKIRKGIVLPEVSGKERHRRDWLMRHHHTKSYQDKAVGPSIGSVDLDALKKSPVYQGLTEKGLNDAQIQQSLDNLNQKPMTWRKGHAIYMLLDPPAEKTVNKDIPTLTEDVATNWGEQVITNQPFNLEKGKFEPTDLEKGTKPRAMTKERKMSEASNDKAHWSILMNLTRNQRVDRSGKTRAEQYVESIPENMRDDETVVAKAKEMDEEDFLHDKDIITAAIMNPATPDWVLMKAATTGYATDIRRLAKAILKRRGWVPKVDDSGNLVKDSETKDFVWVKAPGMESTGSFEDDEFIHAFGQAADTFNMQRQGYQDQINAIDEQMKTMTGQMEQLRTRKTDLEKQRDSVKQAPATQPGAAPMQPAPPAAPPIGTPAMAPGMASRSLSFRKMAASPEALEKAKVLIDNDDEICFDVAANVGQIFANVKHMGWFLEAVAEELETA